MLLELVGSFRVGIPYLVAHKIWWVSAMESRMEWTGQAIDTLRDLWSQGHSTAEIGRRMGVTKNAIVGKAHRLDLPARPSPIRQAEAGGSATAPRRKPSVRDLSAASPARRSPPGQPQASAALAAAVVAANAASAGAVRPFPRASLRSCCWPIGEPGTRDFRFCAAEADAGRPYCAEHAAVAYVRVRDRRSDAA
jgi:GcrA cell cycle regulator